MRSDDDKRTIKELGLKTWASDVLWYHYKWVIMGTLAALLTAAVIIGLTVGKRENDAVMILAVSETMDSTKLNNIKLALGAAAGDLNGDGEIIISLNELTLNSDGEDYDPTITGDETSMMTSFLQKNIVLYLFDKINLDIYASPDDGRFNIELAAEYGGENGAIPLGGVEAFKELGLTGENQLYACFKVKTFNVHESDEEYYRAARAIMDGLLG